MDHLITRHDTNKTKVENQVEDLENKLGGLKSKINFEMGNDRTKNDRRFNEIVEDLGEFKEDYKNVVNHV